LKEKMEKIKPIINDEEIVVVWLDTSRSPSLACSRLRTGRSTKVAGQLHEGCCPTNFVSCVMDNGYQGKVAVSKFAPACAIGGRSLSTPDCGFPAMSMSLLS